MSKDIKLPGLGSYKAAAVERGDDQVAAVAIGAMLILMRDQLVWRPLLAWVDKYLYPSIYFRLACFQVRQRPSSLAIKGEKIKKQATAS